ncbi:MAG: extracellular solute-binding protein [Clostridia bacterium]|nr:extracellular solute-binding protein [Clostridia bacterium]
MKKCKRLMSAALVFALMLSLLTGCGNGKQEEVSSTGDFSKRLELSVWSTQGIDFVAPVNAKENVVENLLIDKTNVLIKNVYGNGGGQWEGVLARLIAGDNFPDLVACGGGQGPVHFGKIAEADKIWELTPEMLQKYAPDIWKKVPAEMWERMKVDGKIYGIPYNFPLSAEEAYKDHLTEGQRETAAMSEPVSVGTDLWIRDDVLKMLYPNAKTWDELNALMQEKNAPIGDELYDVPIESTEDLIKLFEDIKALDLKVGKNPVYAFGYSSVDCWVPLAQMGAQMMGYVGRNYITTWDTEKEEIVLPLWGDTVKEAARLQNKLIRDKVFDPESLVIPTAQFKERLLNGEYAVAVLSSAGHPPFINQQLETNGKPFRFRPLYTNIPAQKGYGPVKTPTSWGASVGILKTVKEANLPQVLNWMNVQFTMEWEEIRYWGTKEAGLYKDNEDGTREFLNEELNKRFILNVSNSLEEADCYGLYDNAGLFSMKFMTASKFEPKAYNDIKSYVLVPTAGGRLSADSPLRTKVTEAPPFEAWSAEYANLDTVSEFWSSRSQWEDPFKLTLAAESDEEFERKWNSAVENLKGITDLEKMTKDMTEIARGLIQ